MQIKISQIGSIKKEMHEIIVKKTKTFNNYLSMQCSCSQPIHNMQTNKITKVQEFVTQQ